MQTRILAGSRRLMVALAIASLVVAQAGAAAPVSKGTTGGGTPLAPRSDGETADASSRGMEPVYYQRSHYVWPFSSGPVYGTLDATRAHGRGVLHTAVGSFDLTHGMPALPNELRGSNRLGAQGSQYFLMQVKPETFTNGSFDEMKRAIAASGGAIVGEIPVAAFLVRMTPGAFSALRSSGDIVSLEPYPPAFKIAPEIGRIPLLDAAKASSTVYSLSVQLFPGESSAAVANSLTAMGAHVTSSFGDKVVVDADRSQLAAIANLEPVFMISEVLPILAQSEEMSTTIQTGRWNNGAAPYNDAGVDGGGLDKTLQSDDQLLLLVDTGIQLDAGDLSDTRTNAGLDGSGLPIAGHRKVAFYGTTNAFGGSGDLLGCDGPTTSGVTHGHAVAVVALGNATKVPASYGLGWTGVDGAGNKWGLDGVAPKARLVAYDAQVTPLTGRCDDPTQTNGIFPGTLYSSPGSGVLYDGLVNKGARTANLSFGVANAPGTYAGTTAAEIDSFLGEHSDAAVFVPSGNTGRDLNGDRIPDPNTIGPPGTSKNAIVVGASQTSDDFGDPDLPNARWSRSSNGPASPGSNRIAPLLMAPGQDAGRTGLASTFNCRSNDNSQTNPVECDVIAGVSGLGATSYASAAAAGAGLLVRDYFAQGFYPDGTIGNPGNASDKVGVISGDLLKAVLVASADWMNQPGTVTSQSPTNRPWSPTLPDFYGFTGNQSRKFRGNREQGFGRIQLTNALPLQTYPSSIAGLIVGDGGALPAGLVNSTTLNLKILPGLDSLTCSNSPSTSCTVATQATDCGAGTCVPYTFNVCDTSQPLTAVIAWTDPSNLSDVLTRHLTLPLTAPSGRQYLGNFFTDDVNDNAAIDAGEDCTYTAGCPWPPQPSLAGTVDTGPWSLPSVGGGTCGVTCTVNNHVDINNPVQAIFLSPDSQLNGIANDTSTGAVDESADNQVEQGAWSVLVYDPATVVGSPNSGAQTYSIAITGGVCLGSSARVQKVLPSNQLGGATLTCNDSAVLTIDEIGTPGIDPVASLTPAEIASRTMVEVVDANGVVVDTECGALNLACTASQRSLPATDFTQTQLTGNNVRFDSRKITLTDGTAQDPGNGVLDVRDGQTVRVTYQDESPNGTTDPNGKRTGSASVNCKPAISSGGVVFGLFGRNSFSLVSGGCEKDARGYFTFGFPDRYMDAGELVSYTITFQSAELGTTLTNLSISLRAVVAGTNTDSAYLTVLDSPKVYGSLPAGKTFTPTFTIQMAASIPGTQQVEMLVGISAKSAGKGVETVIRKKETLNADATSIFYSTDFPTGGAEPVGGWDSNNNEILETVTNDPASFSGLVQGFSDYIFETRSYASMVSTGTNTELALQAPWNFDTCSTGGKCTDDASGFVTGLNNTSRISPGVYAQWGEDKNFNGRLDGFCSLDTSIPCTQGVAISENCKRCSGNKGRECNIDSDCAVPLPNEGTCVVKGTCNFALGEDRNPVNGAIDRSWSTAGGCGWQTKAPAAATGGAWHTGLIRDLSSATCLAAGNDPARCQSYFTLPDGDLAQDNEWWELLLTPVLNKVNQGVDGFGDPVYQAEITDWAWNMLVDFPDANTQLREEFDTDINKVQGVELFNDTAVLNAFGGAQGAVSGGNAPITGGYNMFAQISHCADTDGNGSPDHCGTAAGSLCGSDVTNIDLECTGFDISKLRGHCITPPAQKKCTGSLANCSADNTCPTNERCVDNTVICAVDADCAANGGTCVHDTGTNREGKNSCYFEGKLGSGLAKAQSFYGLASPPDDDQANGYCLRSDSLSGFDKSKSCVKNSGVSTTYDSCTTIGAPYTTCDTTNHPGTAIDQFVQMNGPGRNFGVKNVNGPDMVQTTLEDFYGDTGNQFRGSLEFFTREATATTPSVAGGFGIAVDDMVVSWKETSLSADSGTHCATGGVCADIETSTGRSFEGNSIVNITVTDASPYDGVNNKNDCNGDGDYTDLAKHCLNFPAGTHTDAVCTVVGASCVGVAGSAPGEYCYAADSQDCNDNTILDVVVRLITDTPGETTGELAVLDRVGATSVYKAAFPYSTFYDSPGTLFVVQSGTQPPSIRAIYTDRNDGTGSACKNDLNPSKQGQLESDVTVTVNTGRIAINAYKVFNVSTCSLDSSTQCVTNGDCAGTCTAGTAGLLGSPCNIASTCGAGGVCGSTKGICNSCSNLVTKPCDPGATAGGLFCSSPGICTSTAGKGDPDGFPDTNETIQLDVQFANKSGVDVDDLTATLGTTSPNIECITRSAISVGALANNALSSTKVCSLLTSKACVLESDCTNPSGGPFQGTCRNSYPPFQLKIANVNRTSVSQTLQAPLTITMRSNKFDALTRATGLTLDLDLNASGAQTVSAFLEDFELTSAFPTAKFQQTTLDANKNSIQKSFGYRCQINDPFGLNSYSVGNTECFLGFATDSAAGVNDWHIHTSTHGGMGRALAGKQSAHWGVHLSVATPTLDTYRFKQLDAITTINPINIPLSSANPELNFAQQVSFIDNSAGVNVTSGEATDRGVVEVQAASSGVPEGVWTKIYPFQNAYDTQGTDDFSNCMFDPTDDGNDEKSFFDPTDPQRTLGPSSLCFPEFTFVRQGQTDYRKTFDVSDIQLASDGPGLQGCVGGGCLPANTPAQIFNPGTWVRPRFSLAGYGGRTLRLRFIVTTIEISTTQTANLFFGRGDVVGDDGWYVDDIHIDQALNSALTLSADTATIASPIACGSCGSLSAGLTATPNTLSGPGQIVTLEAKTSTVSSCLNGVLQYQFWIDANNNGTVGDGGDTQMRDWTDSSTFVDAPTTPGTVHYGVKIRCSTNVTCPGTNQLVANVLVNCPSSPGSTLRAAFDQTIQVNKAGLAGVEPDQAVTISWATAASVDAVRGDLTSALPISPATVVLKPTPPVASSTFTGTVINCLATNSAPITSIAEPVALANSTGVYYLVRGQTAPYCNQIGPGYTTNASKEKAGRDTQLNGDPVPCP